MDEASSPWSPKQERLAVLIAGGKSIKSAAAEVECGERTAHDWLADRRYRSFVAGLRGRMLDEAVGTLAAATAAAAVALRGLLEDGNSHVRLRAALGILEGAVRLREHTEILERLEELERRAGQGGGNR
jgi:hypothetical protein